MLPDPPFYYRQRECSTEFKSVRVHRGQSRLRMRSTQILGSRHMAALELSDSPSGNGNMYDSDKIRRGS